MFWIARQLPESTGKVVIVAEAADTHLGNLESAKALVDMSVRAGVDAIKFQHHLPDEEMLPDVPMSDNFSEPLYEFLKRVSLTIEQHRELKDYCDKQGVIYLCTPFSIRAADEIAPLVPVIKIGSGEALDWPLLAHVVTLGKPMIVSTGMMTQSELVDLWNFLNDSGATFALMHCVSAYPPEYEELNLRFIPEMIRLFPNTLIGYSDHTSDNYSSFAAMALGAAIIEKHIMPEGEQTGPDAMVSLQEAKLTELVQGIRLLEGSLGETKQIQPREHQIRQWAHRSVVTTKPLRAGHAVTRSDLSSKRPGTGIPSRYLDSVVGRKLQRDVSENELLHWADFA